MGTESKGGLELRIHPATDGYDPDDERWQRQVHEFFADLDEVDKVRREVEPVEGTKGGIASVILALGSAGAFTAGVEYFRAWLGRDKTRRLDVSWTVDGKEESVSLSGDGIDEETLQALAAAAATRLGTP